MCFVKPWRQKVGVLTLVVAWMFAAGWIRSRMKYDFVNTACGDSCYRLASRFGFFSLMRETPFSGESGWEADDLSALTASLDTEGNIRNWEHLDDDWFFEFGEINLGAGTRTMAPYRRFVSCTVPYWSIVVPLTTLSAWLLLSKPRQRQMQVGPVPEKAA